MESMTTKEYSQSGKQTRKNKQKDIISAKEYLQLKNKRKNKYNNKKVILDGHSFDSVLEADYYSLLKIRQKVGEILFFRMQPEYLLQREFEKFDKKYRAIKYVADFEVHHIDGSIEVVDTKGVKTAVFRMKEKMFHKIYPHRLTIITKGDF